MDALETLIKEKWETEALKIEIFREIDGEKPHRPAIAPFEITLSIDKDFEPTQSSIQVNNFTLSQEI